MSMLNNVTSTEEKIAEETAKAFPALLQLLNDGLSVLLEANAILDSGNEVINNRTVEGASQTAAWRFLSTFPASARCSLQLAVRGNYLVAKHILRLALEETIKLGFYVSFPREALEQILRDTDNDHINLGEMLKQLDPQNRQGLMKLHGHLSAWYSHANLNLPRELIYRADGEPTKLGGGPSYMPDVFEFVAQQLLNLVANSVKFTLNRFPLLLSSPEWTSHAHAFLKSTLEAFGILIPGATNEKTA